MIAPIRIKPMFRIVCWNLPEEAQCRIKKTIMPNHTRLPKAKQNRKEKVVENKLAVFKHDQLGVAEAAGTKYL